MQLLRGRRQLLSECGDFVGFPLHRRNRRADFFEHAVEALLEEPELVGLRGGGTNGEVSLLRFAHHAARAANALDESRGNALERHRDDDEHAGLEIRGRVETGAARIELAVRPAREQIRDRRDEHEEIADGLALIERVRQHGNEQRRDHAAVTEPDDEDVDEQDVEQRQQIDEPPAVPAALIDEPDDCVDHRRAAGDQDDRAERCAADAAQSAEDA